jgi:predicted nucleic acid-binding protein
MQRLRSPIRPSSSRSSSSGRCRQAPQAHRRVRGHRGRASLGGLAAEQGPIRARRLETLSKVESLSPLPIDGPVAHAWAALRLALRDQGKRMPINDSWIAASAIANRMPVATQDGDYDDVQGLRVTRV